MSNVNKNVQRSEVARLLNRIQAEYDAALNGLSGLAATARHSFITARTENISKLHTQLEELVGDDSMALVVACLENSPHYSPSTQNPPQ